ncbi:TPA: DUF4189 domain-containing protein [Stenotrophomonas maltophilia]
MFLILLALAAPASALAEGRCPPGQYPVGGQGVGGCAPIPGGAGGDAAETAPRPIGYWIKTWGAIALSPKSGDMGAAVGHKEKAAAVAEAQARCATYGAADCKVLTTYKNQCVAYATDTEKMKVKSGTAASKEDATRVVMAACAKSGLNDCKVLYTDCFEPIFKSYCNEVALPLARQSRNRREMRYLAETRAGVNGGLV